MKNWTWSIIVEMANLAEVLGKGLAIRLAIGINATILGRLQSMTFHAHNLLYGITIQWLILVLRWHFSFLFTTETARIQPSRYRMPQFASPGIMGTTEHSTSRTIMMGRSQFAGRKERNLNVRLFIGWSIGIPCNFQLSIGIRLVIDGRWGDSSRRNASCRNSRGSRLATKFKK